MLRSNRLVRLKGLNITKRFVHFTDRKDKEMFNSFNSAYADFSEMPLDLQLFADGAASGNGDTGASGATAENGGIATSKATAKNPLADVQYGIQEGVPDAGAQTAEPTQEVQQAPDLDAEFEELIKGKFKEQYAKRTQDTIQRRLKGTKETVERYNELSPTLEMLSKKYGVDATDIKALNKAIEEDDAYYEEEAAEKGLTVEQLKSIRKMERENAELKRQMREKEVRENADRLYASWLNQAEAVKGVYPSFDLSLEMQNPKFTDLLKNNVDLRTAYEVLHKDEIIPAAMQFTAKNVQQKVANQIIANGARPVENGMGSQSSAIVKSDVSQLSKADRAEIIRRVARGEKIRF